MLIDACIKGLFHVYYIFELGLVRCIVGIIPQSCIEKAAPARASSDRHGVGGMMHSAQDKVQRAYKINRLMNEDGLV